MVGNKRQKLCLMEGDGDYIGYKDNEEIMELLSHGWVIKQIAGASTNSTQLCYVLLEAPQDEDIAK